MPMKAREELEFQVTVSALISVLRTEPSSPPGQGILLATEPSLLFLVCMGVVSTVGSHTFLLTLQLSTMLHYSCRSDHRCWHSYLSFFLPKSRVVNNFQRPPPLCRSFSHSFLYPLKIFCLKCRTVMK